MRETSPCSHRSRDIEAWVWAIAPVWRSEWRHGYRSILRSISGSVSISMSRFASSVSESGRLQARGARRFRQRSLSRSGATPNHSLPRRLRRNRDLLFHGCADEGARPGDGGVQCLAVADADRCRGDGFAVDDRAVGLARDSAVAAACRARAGRHRDGGAVVSCDHAGAAGGGGGDLVLRAAARDLAGGAVPARADERAGRRRVVPGAGGGRGDRRRAGKRAAGRPRGRGDRGGDRVGGTVRGQPRAAAASGPARSRSSRR